MAKITVHGGASFDGDQPVTVRRAEIGFSDQPVATDETDEDNAVRDTAAKEAEKTEADLAKATPAAPVKKTTSKK